MGKFIDLTGKKFNRLTVLERDNDTKRRKVFWKCQCDCGNVVSVPSSHLKTGNTKSCGCLNRELTAIRGARVAKEVLALPVNHNFFDEWSDDMAYILGFWVADGCAAQNRNSVSIRFSQTDREILQRIKSLLKSEHKIAKEKRKEAWQLRFNSEYMYNKLCSIFGMDVRRKSKTIRWPVKMSDKYARHFMRGLIDGDGCLSYCSNENRSPFLSFTSGSLLFIRKFSSEIERLTGIQCNVNQRTKKTAWIFTMGGIKSKCFTYWLYHEASLFLRKKHKIFKQFLKWKPSVVQSNCLTPKMESAFPQFLAG